MVVADTEMTLLTVCENGYGKRTPFGSGEVEGEETAGGEVDDSLETDAEPEAELAEPEAEEPAGEEAAGEEAAEQEGETRSYSGNMRYRRQRRGGKGLRDIRTSERNGKVIDVLGVADGDEVLMVTAGGKIQRIYASDVSQVGRNTQGVRVIRLDEGDLLVAIARIPATFEEER
jgi:DNA gyrase subunit A